jgi:hypothetical protein
MQSNIVSSFTVVIDLFYAVRRREGIGRSPSRSNVNLDASESLAIVGSWNPAPPD